MRTAFMNELIAQARLHPKIFLVVGDLGFSVVEPFAQEFPDRFLNAGVAEQNMTGVAAGLASEGYHVFTYSIANFPTLRCLEQIRNDVCYHNLSVTVIAVGAGMAYGNLGYSHHAIQDIGIMRTLPGMTVLSPADPGETRECVQWLTGNPCPSYLRLGKAGEPALHSVAGITAGPLPIRIGSGNCAIVASGAVLKTALEVADQMVAAGMQVSVFSCPWLKPVTDAFYAPLHRFQRLVVLEEHVAEGGLTSILREQLPRGIEIESRHVPESVAAKVGGQEFLRQESGMKASDIVRLLR
jgi:transketolase